MNLTDITAGLKYFTGVTPQPFWAILPGAAAPCLPQPLWSSAGQVVRCTCRWLVQAERHQRADAPVRADLNLDGPEGYRLKLWKTSGVVDAEEDDMARQVFSRLCPEGSPLVVDVGSNIGLHRAERHMLLHLRP